MALNLVFLAFVCALAGYGAFYSKRRIYRSIDRMLDCVLSREEIEYSDVKEGELSALANKITRIKEVLEKQIQSAEEEKEQVKGIVSNLSHQLKTPLANLSVYTDILTGQEMDEEQKTQICEKLKRQIDKLDWIIGSLAKMVKLEQNVIVFEAGAYPIKDTIRDAIDSVYEKIEKKGLSIESEPYEDRLLYHNKKWTAEVFVNLLENAVKYTKRGGAIQIRVKPYEMYTEIQIADNGCGIKQEETTQIFRRFYRGSQVESIEGSGIGLYLSSLILEKEKGYMTVKSVYGEGSCFSVFLQNCKNNLSP